MQDSLLDNYTCKLSDFEEWYSALLPTGTPSYRDIQWGSTSQDWNARGPLEELELQVIEAADAGIVFAPAKTITELVKEATAAVGKVKEDRQKTDSEDEADEESTPIRPLLRPRAIEKPLLYATGRGDMGILNGSMDQNTYEELVRGRKVSELVQTKMSDFAPKSTAPQIYLDMCD